MIWRRVFWKKGFFLNCKKNRDIYSLFNVFNCSECDKINEDYDILIGNNKISVYYIINRCIILNDEIIINDIIDLDVKLKRLLYDICHYQNDIIVLLFENFVIDDYFELFDWLLFFGKEIHVISV